LVARERKENTSLHKGTIVASLDVVIRILEDPKWNNRARKVKTLKELRQIILDFCEAHGGVTKIDEETSYTHE